MASTVKQQSLAQPTIDLRKFAICLRMGWQGHHLYKPSRKSGAKPSATASYQAYNVANSHTPAKRFILLKVVADDVRNQ